MSKSIEQPSLSSCDSDQEYQGLLGEREAERRDRALEKIKSLLFNESKAGPILSGYGETHKLTKEQKEKASAVEAITELYREKSLEWALGEMSADDLEKCYHQLDVFLRETVTIANQGVRDGYLRPVVAKYLSLSEPIKRLLELNEKSIGRSDWVRMYFPLLFASDPEEQKKLSESFVRYGGEAPVLHDGLLSSEKIESVFRDLGYSADEIEKYKKTENTFDLRVRRDDIVPLQEIGLFQLRRARDEAAAKLYGPRAMQSPLDGLVKPFFKTVEGFPFRYDATDADIEKGLALRGEFLRIAESVPGVGETQPTTKAGYKQAYESVKLDLLHAETKLRDARDKEKALEDKVKLLKEEVRTSRDETATGQALARQVQQGHEKRERDLAEKLAAAREALNKVAALGGLKSGGFFGKSEQEKALGELLEKLRSSGLL